MDIQIKPLNHTDVSSAEDLSRILIAAWRAGFQGILSDDIIAKYTVFESCRAMFAQILSSGIGTMYLATLNGQPAGLLYWLPRQENIRIEALLTVPQVWGKGVAAALMQRLLADGAAFRAVHVWPFAENHRARRFYEKHGFSPSGNTRMGDAAEVEYIRMIT